jgi:hypothetical protein
VETAMKFAPSSAVYAIHGMSDKALLFTNESLAHRILVIAEAAGVGQGFMTYGLRELISSARVRYEFTAIEIRGTRTVQTEGPTGLILTTTGSVDPELSTRMLAVSVPESPDQTKLVLQALAAQAAGRTGGEADYELFTLLHERLAERGAAVVVPFAPELAELVDMRALRMRRDFTAVLTLVQAHALLHEASQQHDAEGRVIAMVADYEAAYRLVAASIAEGSERAVPERIRETVNAVGRLSYTGSAVTINQLASALGIDGSTARRSGSDRSSRSCRRRPRRVVARPFTFRPGTRASHRIRSLEITTTVPRSDSDSGGPMPSSTHNGTSSSGVFMSSKSDHRKPRWSQGSSVLRRV